MNEILGTPNYINLLIVVLGIISLVIIERVISSCLLRRTLKKDKYKDEDKVTAKQGGLISLSVFSYCVFLSFLLIMLLNMFKILFTRHNLSGEWLLLVTYISITFIMPFVLSKISTFLQPNNSKIASYKFSEFVENTNDNEILEDEEVKE